MSPSHHLGSKLTVQIVVAMLAGAVVGAILNLTTDPGSWVQVNLVGNFLDAVGKMFVDLLKMLMVPVVLVTLVCGTSSLSEPSKLGRVGGKTIVFYLFTTAIAITLALTVATMVNVGAGSDAVAEAFTPKDEKTIKQVFIDMIPSNPVKAMAEGQMLPLILFSIMLGLAITLAGKAAEPVRKIFLSMNEVVMGLVVIVMKLAPIGIFCIITVLCATLGFDKIKSVLGYFLTVAIVLIIHGSLVYPTLLKTLTGLSPLTFFSKMRTAMTVAFTTSSSNATLPVTLRTAEERLGAGNSTASFTVPLGATINMDGTAIMQGVATVFIANFYAQDLTVAQMITVALMAVLASIGAAGVPSVGLVMLATVLAQVGLPVEGIGLIIGVDRLLDMMRTVVNITGDATVTCIVAKSEKDFDQSVFDDPNAGVIEQDILHHKKAEDPG